MIPLRITPNRLWLTIFSLAVLCLLGADQPVLDDVAPGVIPARPIDSIGAALSTRIAEGPFVDATDPALEPIIDEVRRWPVQEVKATEGETVDLSTFGSPDEAGRLVEIVGIIRQASERSLAGQEPLQEWAIEMMDGRIAIAVTTVALTDPIVGRQVRFLGRYSGRIEAQSRDGRTRSWPLFIGRARHFSSENGWIGLPIFILLLGGVVVFLRRRAAAARGPSPINRERRSSSTDAGTGVEVVAEPMSLPVDPADALEVMARQAESESRRGPAEDGE
jgi:hypothetical protein